VWKSRWYFFCCYRRNFTRNMANELCEYEQKLHEISLQHNQVKFTVSMMKIIPLYREFRLISTQKNCEIHCVLFTQWVHCLIIWLQQPMRVIKNSKSVLLDTGEWTWLVLVCLLYMSSIYTINTSMMSHKLSCPCIHLSLSHFDSCSFTFGGADKSPQGWPRVGYLLSYEITWAA